MSVCSVEQSAVWIILPATTRCGSHTIRRENFALMSHEDGMRPALALGRLDAIASKILRHAEILAKEVATEWPSDIYWKIVSVISMQLKQIAD